MIHLACTRGNLGYWEYYSTIMKVEDVVSDKRIITVAESEELYTKNINQVLQREIDKKRIQNLNNYIKDTEERFFASIVVAIHKGQPQWTEINLERNFEIDGVSIDDVSMNFLQSKFGVMTLSGNEEIFALDGQHRLMGLRKAYLDQPEIIGKLELSILFVVHKHDKIEKTRRLFTVLNKFAEKPKGAELIILDEDDAAAIITRRLVSEHEHLAKSNGISNSKTGAISTSDNKSFTTLVTVDNINKILFRKNKNFYSRRPSNEVLEDLYEISKQFWDAIFLAFPELVNYINGVEDVRINEILINRKAPSGGSLLLRPVGQQLLANVYIKFTLDERQSFIDRIKQVDFNLSSQNWIYLFWNDKMLGKELTLKKNLLSFIVGKYDNEELIHAEMFRIYENFNEAYNNHIEQVNLD